MKFRQQSRLASAVNMLTLATELLDAVAAEGGLTSIQKAFVGEARHRSNTARVIAAHLARSRDPGVIVPVTDGGEDFPVYDRPAP